MESTTTSTEIQLVQSPVIKHALQQAGALVTNRLKELNIENLVATDDSVKALKKLSADLNRELKDYEDQRKAIKERVLSPYNDFETVYKTEILDKYKAAIETIRSKTSIVEDKIKANKRSAVKAHFEELCKNHEIDFITFEQLAIDINLSTTEKKYKEQIDAIVSGVLSDLELIDTQDYKVETLVEYKKILNVSQAIINVKKRKEAEAVLAAKMPDPVIKPVESQPTTVPAESAHYHYEANTEAPAPVQQPTIAVEAPQPGEKILHASIRIIGTMAQLMAVKEFLKSNNIEYINLNN